jgi:arylsulfatase
MRDQFHHVNDIVPTIYEVLGITPPDVYRGFEQMPVTGTSMRYTFTDAAAPTRKAVQYYEMMGHRAIYAEGWKAVTRHRAGVPFEDDHWELYDLANDRSECRDLASGQPGRVEQLVDLWWREAETHDVLPLDDRLVELFGVHVDDHSPHRLDGHYTYRPPMSPRPAQVGAVFGGRGWDLDATIERRAGDSGVLYASGTANSGLSVFVQGERLVFDYNCFGDHQIVESDRNVPTGRSVVGVRLRRTDKSGRATLVIDGDECGSVEIPFVMRMMSSVGPSVGYDHGSPVSGRYDDAFPFEGTLHQVDIQLLSSRRGDPAQAAVESRSRMSQQ